MALPQEEEQVTYYRTWKVGGSIPSILGQDTEHHVDGKQKALSCG